MKSESSMKGQIQTNKPNTKNSFSVTSVISVIEIY